MRRILYSSLIAYSLLALSCSSPLKSYRKALVKAPFDVIIVPGIPYEGENWSNNVMKDRVVWSCFLYSREITRNIIYSGNAVYTPYVEGKIMALHAIAMGIPGASVFSETNAEHSTENLIYSYRLAKKMGFKKIVVATDPFQSNTLQFFAWDYGISVAFIPILSDSLNSFHVDSSFHIDPSDSYINDFIPLPQRENTIKRAMVRWV
jgi:vancomycin permeability regulator SanA